MKRSLHAQSGFTLVEILIVMAMAGVIMGALFSLYITNQRTAYTQDETVEVQQNLRIAMDMVTRDMRMAGMLVDYGSNVFPIRVIGDNTGPNGSDTVTTNTASATGRYAKINADIIPAGTAALFSITPAIRATQAGDGDALQPNDVVRIVRSLQSTQPGGDATFTVTAAARQVKLAGEAGYSAPTVTLADATGATMSGAEFRRGDMIAKVNATDATSPSPNTVQYAVVTFAAAPATAATDPDCPANHRCLARRLNNETNAGNPVWQIVAHNIADFQLRYLLDDNSISDAPADRSLVKAVMVTISGATVTTRALSGDTPKTRQLTSVVKLRNRR